MEENFEEVKEVKTEEIKTEETREEKQKNLKKEILDWVKTLFLYCVLPVALFKCFFFVANVPTGSMETTVPTGSSVITTRCFNKDNINRGDVVVFQSDELNMLLFKRCIGLPGDALDFYSDGTLYINGELYEEPYVSSYSEFSGSFTVPEDCYFFCGDNREWSFDARFWENPYINKSEVKGVARFIIFPFSSFGTFE